jgi:hypothetical protein
MKIFTAHLHELNESYFQHMAAALKIAGTMLWTGMLCVVHSVFPFMFANRANDTVEKLHRFYESRRQGGH